MDHAMEDAKMDVSNRAMVVVVIHVIDNACNRAMVDVVVCQDFNFLKIL